MKLYIIMTVISVAFFESIALNADQIIVTNRDLVKMCSKCTSCHLVHRPIEFFEKEANRGNDYAQYNLGVIYENGVGVPVNRKKAFKMYRKSANHGNMHAQYNLGQMYEQEHSVGISTFYAIESYAHAAKKGHTKAQIKLHELSEKYGKGVVEYFMNDYLSAFFTCQKEAENGNYISQICIEQMYESASSSSSGTSEDED